MLRYDLEPPYDRLVRDLREIIGHRWIEGQRKKPTTQRHLIVRWLDEVDAHGARAAASAGNPELLSGPLSGEAQELATLAIDLDLLRRASLLPDQLLARLRVPKEYQGVRYELAVAACFVRSKLPFDWNREGGPEFYVTAPGTSERIAVEAKSRHRPGALGRRGRSVAGACAADVEDLLTKAMAKEVHDHPLIVFIDLNLEERPDVDGAPWWVFDIQELVRRFDNPSCSARFALAVFTNFAWHYAGSTLVATRSPYDFYVPSHPIRPLRYPEVYKRLVAAVGEHGAPAAWQR